METRKYRVIPEGSKGVTVQIKGAFASEQEWRNAAVKAAGSPNVDASFEVERVVRLFPWWLQ